MKNMKQIGIRRRGLIWFLCLSLLCPCFSFATEGMIPNMWDQTTATPAPAFSFRGGIMWNMNRDQVRTLESGLQMQENSRGNWSILYSLSRVDVSKYKADLVYMFYFDQLKMITYEFGNGGTAADYTYLTGALDAVYGEHTEPDSSVVVSIMDQIYPGYYTASNLHSVRSWTAGEDTWIYLYYYTQTAYGILYVNVPAGTQTDGNYVTTGL